MKEKVAEANAKIEDALKSVDEVHQEFGDSTKKALWFAESFGFKLKSIEVESQSGSVVTLPLCTEPQPQEDQPSSADDSEGNPLSS